MSSATVRPALPADFPMLLDMDFVEDEVALKMRFPAFCVREGYALLVAEDAEGRLLGYAAVHDYGPHLRSGNSHRTAKLDDLYTTIPDARKQGVTRLFMRAVEDWARARPLRYIFWYAKITAPRPPTSGWATVRRTPGRRAPASSRSTSGRRGRAHRIPCAARRHAGGLLPAARARYPLLMKLPAHHSGLVMPCGVLRRMPHLPGPVTRTPGA